MYIYMYTSAQQPVFCMIFFRNKTVCSDLIKSPPVTQLEKTHMNGIWPWLCTGKLMQLWKDEWMTQLNWPTWTHRHALSFVGQRRSPFMPWLTRKSNILHKKEGSILSENCCYQLLLYCPGFRSFISSGLSLMPLTYVVS